MKLPDQSIVGIVGIGFVGVRRNGKVDGHLRIGESLNDVFSGYVARVLPEYEFSDAPIFTGTCSDPPNAAETEIDSVRSGGRKFKMDDAFDADTWAEGNSVEPEGGRTETLYADGTASRHRGDED